MTGSTNRVAGRLLHDQTPFILMNEHSFSQAYHFVFSYFYALQSWFWLLQKEMWTYVK